MKWFKFWSAGALILAGFNVYVGQYIIAFLLMVNAGILLLDAWHIGILRGENAELRKRLSERTWP